MFCFSELSAVIFLNIFFLSLIGGIYGFWTWGYTYSKVTLHYCIVVIFLIFWGLSILFSIVTEPIYIPTNSMLEFPSIHILITACCLFDNSQVWGYMSLWFRFAFSQFKWCWASFHVSVGHLYSYLLWEKMCIYISWPVQFLAGLLVFFFFCLFLNELYEF